VSALFASINCPDIQQYQCYHQFDSRINDEIVFEFAPGREKLALASRDYAIWKFLE